MSSRVINYVIIAVLIVSFIASLYNIKNVARSHRDKNEQKEDDASVQAGEDSLIKRIGRFILPTIAMVTFFVACYFISLLIADGEKSGQDKYAGIIFLSFVGLILTIFNFTVLAKDKLSEYVKGKKFSVLGLFMALGVSAIVFGFLDNFGMKLGTEALDNTFLQAFLSPFSRDERFLDHRENIQQNLQTIKK